MFNVAGLTLLITLAALGIARAADEIDLSAIKKTLDQIELRFSYASGSSKILHDLLVDATALRAKVKTCLSNTQQKIGQLAPNGTEALIEKESKRSLNADEVQLLSRIRENDKRLNECLLLDQKTDELIKRTTEVQQALVKRRFAQQYDNAYVLIKNHISKLPAMAHKLLDQFLNRSGMQRLDMGNWIMLSVLLLFAFGSAFYIRNRLLPASGPAKQTTDSTNDAEQTPFATRLIGTGRVSLRRYLPWLLAMLVGSAFTGWHFYASFKTPLILSLFLIGAAVTLVLIGIRATLRPLKPLEQITHLTDATARHLGGRLMLFTGLMAFGYVLFQTPLARALDKSEMQFVHLTFVTVLIINLFRIMLVINRAPALRKISRGIQMLVILILLSSLAAEWFGYHTLAAYLLRGLVGTAMAMALYLGLTKLLREAYEGLDTGTFSWQRTLRSSLDLEQEDPVPGLTWIRLLIGVVLTAGLIMAVLIVWGLSGTGSVLVSKYLLEGIPVGDSFIVPGNLALGIIIFFVMLALSKWVRDTLDKRWLDAKRLEIGARDAIITIAGYIGFVLALVFGLSTAGVEFQNIAIIAGALSVGIGFGLQNIVNNFVSGLILLFERPIRTGDWISVAGTEGYVKKIRVRSTEVQTFDGAEVIVPNSDLISNQVINRTLRSNYGRVIIPIGVAYGSDTELVEKTLLDLAQTVPEVVKNNYNLPTRVYFRAFGNSALEFELRCHIHNVNSMLSVTSALHFKIDKAFREKNLEFTYNVQDINIRSLPAGGIDNILNHNNDKES